MRTSLSLVLLLVASACSLPQQRSRTFAPYAPLQAHITTTTSGGPLFRVNRPAYVAMFYIVPGGGVNLLYPGFGSGSLDGRVFAGSHFANYRLNNTQQYQFARGMVGTPRYYFLIASDRPLNVQQFGSFGDRLHSRLGTSFASFSAYNTMEDLARLTLPAIVDDGSWTTDMYVEWPSVIYTEPGQNRVLLRCGGYAMYVPRAYLQAARAAICNIDDVGETPDEAAEGEGEPVVKPGSRRPLPADAEAAGPGTVEEIQPVTPAQRKALVERLTSSNQLGAPTAREAAGIGRDEWGRNGSGARERPMPGAASSSGSGSRGASTATSRPAPSSGSVGSAGRPSATPTPRAAPSGPVSAPSSRPSTGSGGGESSSGRARGAPTAD
jgi:hypothetical protein